MPIVITKDNFELFEVTQEQAQEILRTCPNIISSRCATRAFIGPLQRGQRRPRIIDTLTIRMSLNRVREWVEQAYASDSAPMRTHYRVLFSSGLWCWAQKRLTESGQFAKWPGEGTPYGARVVKA